MATKRAAAKRTAPAKPGRASSSESDDGFRRFNVLIEDMRGQQTLMLEAMSSMREHFDRTLDEGLRRVEARLDVLESAVRQNSQDIRKNSEDIEAMKNELRRLRVDFDAREERVKIQALEQRVTRLEERLTG